MQPTPGFLPGVSHEQTMWLQSVRHDRTTNIFIFFHGVGGSAACGTILAQGLNCRPLHGKMDS